MMCNINWVGTSVPGESHMGLFKSKDERRIERNIQIQKTMGMFSGQVKKLKKQEDVYIQAARDARRINAPQQEEIAKKALGSTISQRRRLEQQLLTLRIAVQMKEQAETHSEFAKSLRAVGKTIGEMFGSADLVKTQRDFEMAMAKAQSMEQRVDLFLSTSSETMFNDAMDSDESVTAAEIDAMIGDEAAASESKNIDSEIDAGLDAVRKELSKDQ